MVRMVIKDLEKVSYTRFTFDIPIYLRKKLKERCIHEDITMKEFILKLLKEKLGE